MTALAGVELESLVSFSSDNKNFWAFVNVADFELKALGDCFGLMAIAHL